MKKICYSLLLLCLLPFATQADVSIVTSIEPLALIGRAIVGDQGKVTSLVDPRQSPHEYSMRPSDRIAIQQANLLIWIDASFELYLTDIFDAQARQKELITFSRLQNVKLLHETSGELDPHMWLNTGNAAILADAIAQAVSVLDREHENYFQENLQKFQLELGRLENNIANDLASNNRTPYAVYHNAYRYFEEQFGLQHALVFLRIPESQPNVQEIMRVRNSVRELRPKCLLTEYDSNSAIIDTMLNGVEIEKPIVDTLGYKITTQKDGYLTLMSNLAQQFSQCTN